MLEQLIQLLLLTLASVILMIVHELPKSIIYAKSHKKSKQTRKKSVFDLFQYIDPIGLLFCVTSMAGFSKPYVYRINDKKLNRILGLTGFISLLLTFSLSILLINLFAIRFADLSVSELSLADNFLFSFLINMAVISMGMFLVNLLPIATFDMGFLVAASSSENYSLIIRNDYITKLIFLLLIMFRVFPQVTSFIINLFLIV